MRITGTTPRREPSRKTKTRKRTRQATRRAAVIKVIVLRGRPAKDLKLVFSSRTANEGRQHSCRRGPSFAEPAAGGMLAPLEARPLQHYNWDKCSIESLAIGSLFQRQ